MTRSEPKTKAGKSVAAFRAAHDKSFIVPQRIREGLKKLGDGWEYEVDFMRVCGGLATTDIAAFRAEFSDFWFETGGRNPKRVWCATKELAKQLSAMAG